MLYDPKWEQQTKADPFKLETLIAWLESQDPNQQYDYWDCKGRCLYGQYMTHHGIPWSEARASDVYREKGADPNKIYREWFYNKIAVTEPYTFGGALERARKLQAR